MKEHHVIEEPFQPLSAEEQQIRQKQAQGRVGRKGTSPSFFYASETGKTEVPYGEYFTLMIKNTALHIGRGNFTGDMNEAKEVLESFVHYNELVLTAMEHGYNKLTMNNNKEATIPPQGIMDVDAMLQFCEIDPSLLTSVRKGL